MSRPSCWRWRSPAAPAVRRRRRSGCTGWTPRRRPACVRRCRPPTPRRRPLCRRPARPGCCRRVTLPEYLERDAIVVASGARLETLDGERWAEPLRDALPRLLRADLEALRGPGSVLDLAGAGRRRRLAHPARRDRRVAGRRRAARGAARRPLDAGRRRPRRAAAGRQRGAGRGDRRHVGRRAGDGAPARAVASGAARRGRARRRLEAAQRGTTDLREPGRDACRQAASHRAPLSYAPSATGPIRAPVRAS
ncbi:MAG: PqiC family protein [Comamonadaceae bacterium]|nr:PqiC family protein [Comamonadaceae bacterium]